MPSYQKLLRAKTRINAAPQPLFARTGIEQAAHDARIELLMRSPGYLHRLWIHCPKCRLLGIFLPIMRGGMLRAHILDHQTMRVLGKEQAWAARHAAAVHARRVAQGQQVSHDPAAQAKAYRHRQAHFQRVKEAR